MKLEIENLVVNGVAGADSERLVAVIERELRSLAAGGRSGAGGGEIPSVMVKVPAGLGVDDIGREVARSIWSNCQGSSNQTTVEVPGSADSGKVE